MTYQERQPALQLFHGRQVTPQGHSKRYGSHTNFMARMPAWREAFTIEAALRFEKGWDETRKRCGLRGNVLMRQASLLRAMVS